MQTALPRRSARARATARALTLALVVAAAPDAVFAQADPSFTPAGTFATGAFDASAAEIVAYDPATRRAFVTDADANAVVALDLADPAAPTLAFTLDLNRYGGGVNSVAVAGGRVAVAVQAVAKTDPGRVVVFTPDGTFVETLAAGALPDALAFSPDGNYLAVANEGEPNDDYTVDPEGSVQVIDFTSGRGVSYAVDFRAFVGQEDALRARGIRIFGPGADAAQDLEPEYVTWGPDNRTIYVTLQENNALAIIDRVTKDVRLVALGTKDHAVEGAGFDASDKATAIEIFPHPVRGLYQPDAIQAYVAGDGRTYLVTANEGDARDYDGYSEEARVEDLTLDPTAYPDAAGLQSRTRLGRLKTTTALGDPDGDGDVDQIYSYGARSFSIWDADGALVFDSGDAIEKTVAALLPGAFNANNDDNDSRKSRSDDKGPEPEAVAVGTFGGRSYALIGLERQSGIVVYEVTDPRAPRYVSYFDRRDFGAEAGLGSGGDLGPEGIVWVDAADSPTGAPLVLVANEVSGTVSAYTVAGEGDRFTLQLLHTGAVAGAAPAREALAATLDSARYAAFLRGVPTVTLASTPTADEPAVPDLRFDDFAVAAGVGPVAPGAVVWRGRTPLGLIAITDARAATPVLAAAIQAEVDALAARGVDKSVLLAGAGARAGLTTLIAELSGIDLVVAAREGDEAYPLALTDATGRTVYLATAGAGGAQLGVLYATFDANGEVVALGADSRRVTMGRTSTERAGATALRTTAAGERVTVRGTQSRDGARTVTVVVALGRVVVRRSAGEARAGEYEEVIPLTVPPGTYTVVVRAPDAHWSEVVWVE